MFIKFGNRRINLFLIKEYEPISKLSSGKTHYSIYLKYFDNSSEYLNFFASQNQRNIYLDVLDKNLLDRNS